MLKQSKPPIAIIATITPCKCNNPEHPEGCPFGYHLIDCAEEEAHTWVGSIVVGDVRVWGTKHEESTSREAATAALLNALSKGVTL